MGYKWCRNDYEIFHKNVAGIIDADNNVAYIDEEDLERVYPHTFHKDNSGYFRTSTKEKRYLPLHDIIVGEYDHSLYIVDHINGCKLDNRKCNLRIVTQKVNCLNRRLCSRNTTGFTGVSYDKTRKRYVAFYGKQRIGRYKTINEAVKAREDFLECQGIT